VPSSPRLCSLTSRTSLNACVFRLRCMILPGSFITSSATILVLQVRVANTAPWVVRIVLTQFNLQATSQQICESEESGSSCVFRPLTLASRRSSTASRVNVRKTHLARMSDRISPGVPGERSSHDLVTNTSHARRLDRVDEVANRFRGAAATGYRTLLELLIPLIRLTRERETSRIRQNLSQAWPRSKSFCPYFVSRQEADYSLCSLIAPDTYKLGYGSARLHRMSCRSG
jgi:hypothetical protein